MNYIILADKRSLKLSQIILIVSFSLSIPIAIFNVVKFSGSLLIPLSLLFLLALLLGTARILFRKSINFQWILVFAALNAVVVIPELFLRAVDFNNEFGYFRSSLREDKFQYFIPHKKLLWTRPPSAPGVNSLGFIGNEIRTPKPKKTKRIIILGDSCAEQGYARLLEAYLNNLENGYNYECILLAVAGYSSFQGKMIASEYGDLLDPDLVLVCYGWNDHWDAVNCTDEEAGKKTYGFFISNLYREFRILQLGRMIYSEILDSETELPLNKPRVNEKQYYDNCLQITEHFKDDNIPVIFMTAPTSFYKYGVPDAHLEEKLIPSDSIAIARHKSYNDIIRKLTSAEKIYLLDLEKIFNDHPRLDDLILNDGIHYTGKGMYEVSTLIYNFLNEIGFNSI